MKQIITFFKIIFSVVCITSMEMTAMGQGELSLPQVWGKNVKNSTLPGWFGTDVTRGMAAWNHRLYVVTRILTTTPKTAEIRVLNAETGEQTGMLSVNGLDGTGGHLSFVANDIEVSEDGQILTCNLALGSDVAAGMNKFKIFKWASETADPKLFLEYDLPADVRMGDHFTVQGSFAAGKKACIYAATAYHPGKALQNDKIYMWTVTGGVLDSPTPEIIQAKRLLVQFETSDYYYVNGAFGSDPKVAPAGISSDEGLVVNGNSMYPTLIDKTGATCDSLYFGYMNWSYPFNSSIVVFSEKGRKFLATVACDPNINYDANLFVKDISTNMNNGEGCFSTSGIGDAVNGNRTSDIATDTINGNRYIFMLWTNNGITAHRLDGVTTTTRKIEKKDLFSVFPNPVNRAIRVSNVSEIESIGIFSIAGTEVLRPVVSSQVDLGALTRGIYLVKIIGKQGQVEVHKIIKNE
jgi:hypothetical protein